MKKISEMPDCKLTFPCPDKVLKKPPLGLMPKSLYKESIDKERLIDVSGAIQRYYEAGLPINIEWIKEYNELCYLFQK